MGLGLVVRDGMDTEPVKYGDHQLGGNTGRGWSENEK